MQSSISSKRNGVNGIFSILNDSSPGRELHVEKVEPDRQPATVRNKDQLKIGTWNVRTLYEEGKFTNVQLEMTRLDIDMLGLCEVRWKGAGKITSNDYTFIYSGGNEHRNGVGLMMKNYLAKVVSGYWPVSERVLVLRIKGNPFDLSIIQVYAPISDCSDEKIDEFYEPYDEKIDESIFIAIPKKIGTTECELHRTISLMSHVTKIILRVILLRARSKIGPEMSEEQYGFMQDKGTRNAIYILRTLAERAIEMQRDIFLCFIDYSKAFDRVKHKELMQMLSELDIDQSLLNKFLLGGGHMTKRDPISGEC